MMELDRRAWLAAAARWRRARWEILLRGFSAAAHWSLLENELSAEELARKAVHDHGALAAERLRVQAKWARDDARDDARKGCASRRWMDSSRMENAARLVERYGTSSAERKDEEALVARTAEEEEIYQDERAAAAAAARRMAARSRSA